MGRIGGLRESEESSSVAKKRHPWCVIRKLARTGGIAACRPRTRSMVGRRGEESSFLGRCYFGEFVGIRGTFFQ